MDQLKSKKSKLAHDSLHCLFYTHPLSLSMGCDCPCHLIAESIIDPLKLCFSCFFKEHSDKNSSMPLLTLDQLYHLQMV